MKKGKILVSVLVLLIFIGCNPKNERIRIGVVQYANQAILDSVYFGISQKFQEYGEKYKVVYQVAHGDAALNTTIVKQMVKDSLNLIIALGTPSAQAVMNETKSIPLVFTAITDPVGAKLAEDMEKPGGNKTGLTNMQPFDKQVELIKILRPNAKRVGIIINSSEANCVAGMLYVRQALDALSITYEELNASTTTEIAACAQALATRCDVFFISPSNTLYENLGALKREADKKGIMVVGGDKSAVSMYGSIGTYTYDFVEMGINTTELAVDILENNLNPGNIPVGRPKNTYLYLNKEVANTLKITIPDYLGNIATD